MLHRAPDRSSYVTILLMAALLLAGCPGNSAAPATSTPGEPAATVALLASPTLSATEVPTAVPTATEPPSTRSGNLRAGPGTNYAVVGSAPAQQVITPLGRNEAGDWLQIGAAAGEAWIAAFLVENVDVVALPVHQSTAPTLTPAPQPPASTPAPAAQPAPVSGSVSCGR